MTTLLIVAGVVALLAGAGWAAALGADDTGEMTKVRRGVASGWDITAAMSRVAMWATTVHTRPRSRVWPWSPIGELGIDLGYTKWFSRVTRRVMASFESVVLVVGPPGVGKALALDTPIATPNGWTTMGELQVGDEVFDRDGRPCHVTALSPIFMDHECYEVTTKDGERIVADADHQWVVRLDRRTPEALATTSRLARSRTKRARIDVAPPLDLPDAELPTDPYLLGLWLGDGKSNGAEICSADPEVFDRIRKAGYTVRQTKHTYDWYVGRKDQVEEARREATKLVLAGMSGTQARIQAGLSEKAWLPVMLTASGPGGPQADGATPRVKPFFAELRELGMFNNKHVPDIYMRGSYRQRLALLQGLIDSDGHVDRRGSIEFCSTNERLARDVRELVFTLGGKAGLTAGPAKLYGRSYGTRYRVNFYMNGAASLRRKAERCRDGTVRLTTRYVDAALTDTVPTRCISVDSPSRTYLAGRSLLITHNSGNLAGLIAQGPGPVVAATTAIDLWKHTHESRAQLGPVWVINPDNDGGVPTTGVWPIVPGCEDPQEARLRAISLINGASTDNLKDAAYWEGHAHRTLYCMLLAAALDGATMLTVAGWATDLRDKRPYEILTDRVHKGRVPSGWPAMLQRWHNAPAQSKLLEGVESILHPTLEFMAVPTLAACVLPRPGVEVFDAETLIRNNGTLYIVARDEEGAPSGPYTAALTAHLHRTAVRLGARERLDPPFGEILDEPAHTARVPLPEWTATARKSGIYIVVGYQDPSQLRTMFGEDGAATVEANAVMKIGFNSVNDKRHLEYLSMLAGSRVDRDGDRPTEVPVLKPEHIKNLPDGQAVAIYKNHRPVIFTPQPIWDRKPVKRPTTPPRPPGPSVVDLDARRGRRKAS